MASRVITSKRQIRQVRFSPASVLPEDLKCIVNNCNLRYTTFHAPYCEEHSPVYIAESKIPNGGNGLFAKHDLKRHHRLCNYCSGAKAYRPSQIRNDNMRLQNGENTDYTLGIFFDNTLFQNIAEAHELVFDSDPDGVRHNAQPVNIASYANDARRSTYMNNLAVGAGSTDDAGTPNILENFGWSGPPDDLSYTQVQPGDFYTEWEIKKDDELFLDYGDAYWDDPNVTPVVLRLTAGSGLIAGSSGSHGSGPSPALVNPPPHGTFTQGPRGPPSPAVVIDLTGDEPQAVPQAPYWWGGNYNTHARNHNERLDGRSNIDTNRFTFRNVR